MENSRYFEITGSERRYDRNKTLVVFTLGALLIGVSAVPVLVIVGRVLEGIGVGIFSPQIAGIIQHYFFGQARAWAFSFLELTIAASVAVGPIISGSFVHFFGQTGWRWSFLTNVPLGIIALLLGSRWLPFSRPLAGEARVANDDAAARRVRADLDPVGLVLLVLTVLSVMLPEIIHTPWRWWMLIATPFLAFACIRWEARYERAGGQPILSIRLFTRESYAGGTLITALLFFGQTPLWAVLAISTQQGLGISALAAGLIGLPNAIIEGIVAMWAAKHALKRGRTVQVGALALIVLGIVATIPVAFAVFVHSASFWWLALPLCVEGLGAGSISAANQTQSMLDVPAAEGGAAGGFRETTQRIATAIGSAVIVALLFAHVPMGPSTTSADWFPGFAWACGTISATITLALVCAVIYRHNGLRTHPELAA